MAVMPIFLYLPLNKPQHIFHPLDKNMEILHIRLKHANV